MSGWWIAVTLAASSAQTARNAMQRDLIGALGAVGAAQVRFLFGLPFAILFLVGMLAVTGEPAPRLAMTDLGYAALASFAQVLATALMLSAMRSRSFAVVIAYTKTEAAQIALFGLVATTDPPTPALLAAIAIATFGVALMSFRSRRELAGDLRSAALGLVAASFFGVAAIFFRFAVIGLATPSKPLAASLILVVGLAIQAATLAVYLGLFDRAGARAILHEWRSSLVAGFMGAFASQLWFIAFALSDAARVRTLALIEAPLAQAVSLKLFREPPSLRDGLGMALVIVGAAILIGSGR